MSGEIRYIKVLRSLVPKLNRRTETIKRLRFPPLYGQDLIESVEWQEILLQLGWYRRFILSLRLFSGTFFVDNIFHIYRKEDLNEKSHYFRHDLKAGIRHI